MVRPRRRVLFLWALTLALIGAGVAAARDAGPPPAAGEATTEPAPAEEPAAAEPAAVDASPGSALRGTSLDTPIEDRLRSLLGLVLIGLIAWALSTRRRDISWRIVVWGVGLQLAFAVLILKTPVGASAFAWLNTGVVALLGYTVEGARFIFGDLVMNNVPVGVGEPGMGPVQETPALVARTGAFFAFNVLPTIIFFSSLMTLLYHLGVMQLVVRGVAWVMEKTMKTSGAETLSAAGNIFVGQTEAPLLIKPFVDKMTMSELMAVMTSGFATVAGGVLAAYVGMLVAFFPDIAGHLIAASVMSAPAALVIAKIMVPEDGVPATRGRLEFDPDKPHANAIDAAAGGAAEGLKLAVNVGAMLLAFIALVALANSLVGWVGALLGFDGLSLELILGWILAPLAWLMGVPWTDAPTVGSLMGMKTVLNEFVAYLQLSSILGGDEPLAARSVVIVTYALCGFANFSSIAIQIGGIGSIAPGRRGDLSRLGLRAMIGGSLAAFMTATIAGMLI